MPDANQIVADAKKLREERYKHRNQMLANRARERFNETYVDVPVAYQKTAHQHESSILEDEGRQIGTLVYAMPVPHIPPPTPEDQPLTTAEEKFLMAWHQELEASFGPVWWQCTLAQVHDNIGWIYCGWRKVPYKGQPKAPGDNADMMDIAEYAMKNDRYKREAGVKAYTDYRYVPSNTAYWEGNVYDPDCFWEIKEVSERTMMRAYGVTKQKDGSYTKASEQPTTLPSAEDTAESKVTVIEYWDRESCYIVVETVKQNWMGRQSTNGYLLTEWNHGWGRVPYFARPAFVSDQVAEEKKFTGPLDGIYTEMPQHKRIAVMSDAVSYQTAFAPLQIESTDSGEIILDDDGQRATFIQLKPGEAFQLAPGQKLLAVPQSPEVRNLYQEKAASQARIEHYSLSPVSKGVAPGADTANSALSNLHRFQLSTLDPMAQQASRQASAIYRFAIERIEDMNERVFAFDDQSDAYLSLAGDEIVSVNVQAKVTPDQGQFQLLIEKHAAELKQLGLITLQEMFEMWGKENPEEYVLELKAEKLADSLEPVINQQIISDLGMLDAVNAMIQANQQQGSARAAVPGLMNQIQQMNPTGQGQGSGGQPRTEGVRSPTVQTTTQPVMGGA